MTTPTQDRVHAAVFEQAAVGIARVATDGSWLAVNQRLCDIVGYARDELLARTFQDITHPDDLDEDLGLVAEMLAGTRDRYTQEKRYIHKDGHIVPIRLHVALARHPDGSPDFFISVVQDISPQRAAEREAQRLGRQLVALLENTTDFIYIKDAHSRVLACSQTMATLTGHDDWRDVIGKHDRDLFPPDTARIYEEEEGPLFAGEVDVVDRTDPYWSPTGELRWVHTNKCPVRSDDGEVVGLVGISRDVTDQRRLEEELESTKDRLRVAGSLTYDAHYEWHPGRDHIDWDERVNAQLGLPEGTLGPRLADWLARVHPDDRARVSATLDRAIEAGEPFVTEYRVLHADGGERIWEERAVCAPQGPAGPPRWVGVCTDITRQRALEAEAERLGRQLAALLDNTTDFLYFKDREGRLTAASRSLARLQGHDDWRDVIGLLDHELYPAEDADRFVAEDRRVMATGEPLLGQIDGKAEAGFFVRTSKWPLRDPTGSIVGVVGISRDVTEEVRLQHEMAATQERLHVAGSLSYDVSYIWFPADGRLEWHDGVDDQLGLPRGTLGSDPDAWLQRIHPDDRGRLMAALERHATDLTPIDYEYRIAHADGAWRIWHDRAVPMVDATGRPERWIGVCTDVTDRRAVEQAQADALARLRLARDVVQYASEGITVTDPDGTIVDVNEAFTDITGYSRDEAVGANPRILKSGRHDEAFYEQLWTELLQKGEWTGEIWNRRKSGEVYPERLTISAVRDEGGELQNYVALFADITRQKRFEAALRHTAQHDALTGLPNRLLLQDRLEQALRRADRTERRVAVAYLDLDGFKNVNDTHGHAVGDQLLVALAQALRGSVRKHDTIARIGGDEFVAVLTDLSPDMDPGPELERLRSAAARPHPIGGRSLGLSASLGVSFYPQDPPVDADGLLRQADQAMYMAKQAGRDRVQVFEPEANRLLQEKQALLSDLGEAIVRDELHLRYQPKVHMRSGEVVGVEALVRWDHPTRGPLRPGQFVPLAEGTDRCVELGEWVVRQALADQARWRAQGLDVPVSVNISPYHLLQPEFVTRLAVLLDDTPGRLEIEVVESAQLADIQKAGTTLRRCQQLGVRISIDDFGTGYASLTWLRRLPVDHVKLDRSFVADMLIDRDDRAILEATLGLAGAFDLGVIAEGVEFEELGTALLEMGCDVAQGFAIARPMPADAVVPWAEGWTPPVPWRRAPEDGVDG